jgi:hypothetical protein
MPASIRYFEESIAADPNYAPRVCWSVRLLRADGIHSRRSATSCRRPGKGKTDGRPRAGAGTLNFPEAHNALALVKVLVRTGLGRRRRGISPRPALNPDNVTHAPWHTAYLVGVGQPERALAEIYRAREIDPLSPIMNAYVGAMQFWAGQPDLSIRQLRDAISLDPSFYTPYFFLGKR